MIGRIDSRRISLLALASLLAGTGAPTAAQVGPGVPVITDIAPDFDPGRDLGTTVQTVANVHTIDGGTLAGANLFHSFASFSLAQAEAAQWVQSSGNPANTANVINRVTGGGASFISGTLDSTAIPNAAFWFINPAGIVFGNGAQVNVPAAAHFSTAASLLFTGGESFEIATPDGSTLSVAAPEAFGFLGGEGPILFGGTGQINTPGTLSLTASDIALEDSQLLTLGLTLAAVGDDAATVSLDGSSDRPLTGELALFNAQANAIADAGGAGSLTVNGGTVLLDGSQLGVFTVSDASGGDLRIESGSVALANFSTLAASSNPGAAGNVGSILVAARDQVTLSGGSRFNVGTQGDGRGGDLEITADTVSLSGSSMLFASSFATATGDSGDIRVVARSSIDLSEQSLIQGSAVGAGNGGDVLVEAPEISANDSLFAALTFATGDGGDLTIFAADSLTATTARFFASSLGTGGTGNILLSGGEVTLFNPFVGAQPSTIGGDQMLRGSVGNIEIAPSGALSITGGTITTATVGSGNAGDILLSGDSVALSGVGIVADTTNFDDATTPGNAGQVLVNATGLVEVRQTNISSAANAFCSDACASGNAGSITLDGGQIAVSDSTLATRVSGSGDAGSILLISTGSIGVANSSFASDAFSDNSLDGGTAGVITVFADGDITLDAATFSTDNFSGTAVENFNSGFIGAFAGGSLAVNESFLSSQTFGSGDGGDVFLDAGTSLTVTGGTIASDSFAQGNAGIVSLAAADVRLDRAVLSSSAFDLGNAGSIFIESPSVGLSNGSNVTINSQQSGIGGLIGITAANLSLDASTISANASNGFRSTVTDGLIELNNGIDINGTIPTELIVLRNGAAITTNTNGPGDGGSIQIDAVRLELIDSNISAESVPCEIGACGPGGPAGRITIAAHEVLIAGSDPALTSAISSNTQTEGRAGDISLGGLGGGPSVLTLTGPQARISSQSASAGDAGSINIAMDSVTIDQGAQITTTTSEMATGQGGDIAISTVGTLLIANGGKIEADTNFVCPTDACGNQGRGGTISIAAGGLNLFGDDQPDTTYIRANSFGTADAGQIMLNIFGDLTATDRAYISSDAFGDGRSGGIAATIDETLSLAGGAFISSNVGGAGNAGDVGISAKRLKLDAALIASDAQAGSAGNAGTVTVATDDLDLFGARISSNTGVGSTGDAGDVTVTVAATALLDFLSAISSDSNGDGRGGLVAVSVGQSLDLFDSSMISANASGAGQGGSVSVSASSVALDLSAISTDAFGTGDSGDVEVSGDSIQLVASFISSDALGSGNGGSASATASGNISLADASYISSDVKNTGDGGTVTVQAASMTLSDESFVSSSVLNFGEQAGAGNAGDVTVDVTGSLELFGGSSIASDTDPNSTGNSGQVFVRARDIRLSQGSAISSTTLGDGNALQVEVEARGALNLELGSVIASNSEGAGDAGFVSVTAPRINVTGRSAITSDTRGDGDAQIVSIVTDMLNLSDMSLISSNSLNELASGAGGGVFITGGVLNITGGSAILTNAFGTGNAGDIFIDADAINLRDATIASESASNRGGFLQLEVETGLMLERAHITTNSTGPGPAGDISITSGSVGLAGGSTIASQAEDTSTNRSGAIGVNASGALTITDASSISTTAANDQNAGSIFIEAGNIRIEGIGPAPLGTNSRITSANTGTGAAGAIEILQTQPGLASGITLSEGAEITTRADPRVGSAGTIAIDMAPGSILRLEGRTANSLIDTSGSSQGAGGKVTIGGTGAPYAVILNGGSILALGQTDPALLSITSGFLIRSADRENRIAIGQGEEVGLEFEDVSSGTVSTNLDVLDASRVLSGACPAARASGQYSQLARPLIGPYAVEPVSDSPVLPPPPDRPVIGTSTAPFAFSGFCR